MEEVKVPAPSPARLMMMSSSQKRVVRLLTA